MFELVLKFENEAAMEAVAKDVLNIEVGEYVENTAPNTTERVGDTIFFTRQPEPELTTTQYAVVEPDGSQVVSEIENEGMPVFTEPSGSNGEELTVEYTDSVEEVNTTPEHGRETAVEFETFGSVQNDEEESVGVDEEFLDTVGTAPEPLPEVSEENVTPEEPKEVQ